MVPGTACSLPMARYRPLALLLAPCFALACASPDVAAPAPSAARELPARFEGGRFFVTPRTAAGETLRLFTDTGGGLFLLRPAVARLSLPVETAGEGEDRMELVALPTFDEAAWIPGLPEEHDARAAPFRGRLPVLDEDSGAMDVGDGMLGEAWFAGRVWSFDYSQGRLLLHAAADEALFDPAHTVRLGFRSGEDGKRLLHFPSVEATIDGETLPFLLDTGATVTLSEAALAELGDGGPAARATCFVVASVFDRWRARHPDWRCIESADRGARGALGGSLLSRFVVTVDDPAARAGFRGRQEAIGVTRER